MGDRLGHVTDVTDVDPHARAYRARQELSLHTDLSDIASLLCLHPAGSGGQSQFASALAIHNEMLATRPDLLAPLYRGFRWHRMGEHGAGEEPVTPHRVPHFSHLGGRLSCRYVRNYIREGAFALGEPLDRTEEEALDVFDEIARCPAFRLELILSRGTAVFVNNLTVLHARSAFENHGDPAKKRHLLRLWLASHAAPAVVPEIQIYGNGREGGIPKQEDGRMPSFKRSFETG
jgi:hypothetical protein